MVESRASRQLEGYVFVWSVDVGTATASDHTSIPVPNRRRALRVQYGHDQPIVKVSPLSMRCAGADRFT